MAIDPAIHGAFVIQIRESSGSMFWPPSPYVVQSGPWKLILDKEARLKITRFYYVALLTTFFLPTMASAQVDIPPAWGGIWDVSFSEEDCLGNVLFTDTESDTVCPGPFMEEDDNGNPLMCTGTITDTDADVICTSSYSVAPGCLATETSTLVITRTLESYSGTDSLTIVYTETTTGDCAGFSDECDVERLSATRISTDTSSCPSTPVQPLTWSRLKARYE